MLLQSRGVCLAAAGLLHLEEEEKRQHEQQHGLEIEEETTPSTRKKLQTVMG